MNGSRFRIRIPSPGSRVYGVQIRDGPLPANVSINSLRRFTKVAGSVELTSFGKRSLIEQDLAPVGESALVGLIVQAPDDGMTGIDLEDRLRRRNVLSRRFQHPLEVRAHAVVIAHQARGRIRQTVSHAHRAGAVDQRLLHPLDEPFVLLGLLFLFLLRALVAERAQVESAFRDRLQRLAVEFGERGDDPLVDPVVQQQHFDAELPEDLEVGAVPRGGEAVGRDVVDRGLLLLHPPDVVGERDCLFLGLAASSMRIEAASRCVHGSPNPRRRPP